MVVSDRFHQNAGCAEPPFVLSLEVDRKDGQLPGVEETTHSGDTSSAHEVRPFNDAGQGRVRRPRPVCCHFTALGGPEVKFRVHRIVSNLLHHGVVILADEATRPASCTNPRGEARIPRSAVIPRLLGRESTLTSSSIASATSLANAARRGLGASTDD
jgi:hypothetical protein